MKGLDILFHLVVPAAICSFIYFCSTSPEHPNSRSTQGMLYDQFVLFGDSLFQHSSSQERGYTLAPALQAEYIRRLDVVNRGFSGFNTNQAVRVIGHVIPSREIARVRFLVIFFGANDSCLKGAAGSQHVPLERYEQNMATILTHPLVIKQEPRVIVVTPPPINEYACEENDRTKGYSEPRRKAKHTKLYADAAKRVARAHGATVLDLYSLFMTHAGQVESDSVLEGSKEKAFNPFLRMLLHDGLHFTNMAYTLFFEELMHTIHRVWPDQMPDKLPFVLPAWNDRDSWPSEDFDQ